MTEQPALKDDVTASWLRTVRDLVKAERERDEALAALARVRALAGSRPPERRAPNGNFLGFATGNREQHRTVSPRRAWSYDRSEWCYPSAPCEACEAPIDRDDIRAALEGP